MNKNIKYAIGWGAVGMVYMAIGAMNFCTLAEAGWPVKTITGRKNRRRTLRGPR